jgi:hypothetical protein
MSRKSFAVGTGAIALRPLVDILAIRWIDSSHKIIRLDRPGQTDALYATTYYQVLTRTSVRSF